MHIYLYMSCIFSLLTPSYSFQHTMATALKNVKSIVPLFDRVLVQRLKAEAKTASGIYIPEKNVEKLNEGKVLAVGPGIRDKEGKLVKPSIKSGARVLIPPYGGSNVKVGDVLATAEGEAKPLVAPFDGVVEVAEDTLVIAANASAPVRYEVPGNAQLVVKANDQIKAGDRLTIGSLNLHDLMRLKGTQETQRYIINEVLRIYAAQGQDVADKHLEIIVRQMFSRVQVEDAGDSNFVTGDIVSKAAVVEANEQLAREGKELAQYTQLLLGITKVSIWSDSWLSAASFQDTTRVLINAATSGRADHLGGLKENVIIGRKIPVGTGARNEQDDVEVDTVQELSVED